MTQGKPAGTGGPRTRSQTPSPSPQASGACPPCASVSSLRGADGTAVCEAYVRSCKKSLQDGPGAKCVGSLTPPVLWVSPVTGVSPELPEVTHELVAEPGLGV